ncbi:MAG: GTP-binding protein [archaeon]|nr:GTP-binding protein [archaeon]
MNVNTEFENLIKLLILGDSAVGKTNFIFRFAENKFSDSYISTIGFDCKTQIVTLPSSKKVVKIQVWDTAGQERYMSINKNLYLRVQGIILLYDVTKAETFEHINIWLKSIQENTEKIPVILVGNKIDLPTRTVSTEEGQELANTYKIDYLEASAKEGTNVKEAFYCIAEKVLLHAKKENTGGYFSVSKGNSGKKSCC